MATERLIVEVSEKGSLVVKRNIENIGKAGKSSASGVDLLKRALGGLTVGLALRGITNTLRNFGQEMSTVQAITGATESQFKMLRDEAKRLGATTRFSATQAAEGASFLARAGFETDEVLSSLDGTLRLAQAGALDLGTAADIASNVLQAFSLSADETGRVVDVLAKTANSSNTNVLQMGEGMKLVAPIASGLGVDLEETAAAMGALSDAGLQATLAGTGLRRVIAELESPTGKSRAIMAQFGVTADEVKVSQVGLTQALTTLRDAGIGAGEGLEIFGQRGGPAFAVLANSIPKVEELNVKLDNAAGTALEMSEIMDDNLNGALFAARSALEALIISFGDLGADNFLTSLFRNIATGLRFMASNLENIYDAVLALGPLFVFTFRTQMVAAVAAAQRAVLGLTAVIAANPLGALAVATSVAVSGLIAFQDEIKVSEDGVVSLGNVFEATGEFIAESIAPVADFFREKWGEALTAATNFLSGFGITFEDVLNVAKIFVNRIIGFHVGLAKALGVVFGRLRDIILNVFGGDTLKFIAGALKSVVSFAADALSAIGGLAKRLLGAVGITAREVSTVVGETLQFEVPDNANFFVQYGADVSNAFLEGFNADYVGGLIDIVTPAFDQIGDRAREIAEDNAAVLSPTGPVSGPVGGGVVAPSGEGGGSAIDLQSGEDLKDLVKSLQEERKALELATEARISYDDALEQVRINQLEAASGNSELADQAREQLQAVKDLNAELEKYEAIQTDAAQVIADIQTPLEAHGMQLARLQELYAAGALDAEQLSRAIALIDEELKNAKEELDPALEAVNTFLNRARENAQDILGSALADGFKGGFDDVKSSFTDLLKDLAAQFISSQIFTALGNVFNQEGGGLGGGGSGGGGSGGFAQAAAGILGGFFAGGFANGGSFKVPGQGGVDSQLAMMRVSPQERVTVETPNQQKESSKPFTQVNNFIMPPEPNRSRLGATQQQIGSLTYRAGLKASQRS